MPLKNQIKCINEYDYDQKVINYDEFSEDETPLEYFERATKNDPSAEAAVHALHVINSRFYDGGKFLTSDTLTLRNRDKKELDEDGHVKGVMSDVDDPLVSSITQYIDSVDYTVLEFVMHFLAQYGTNKEVCQQVRDMWPSSPHIFHEFCDILDKIDSNSGLILSSMADDDVQGNLFTLEAYLLDGSCDKKFDVFVDDEKTIYDLDLDSADIRLCDGGELYNKAITLFMTFLTAKSATMHVFAFHPDVMAVSMQVFVSKNGNLYTMTEKQMNERFADIIKKAKTNFKMKGYSLVCSMPPRALFPDVVK